MSNDSADKKNFDRIGFCWALGTHSGWGTYALNFAVQSAQKGVAPAIFWAEPGLILTKKQLAVIGGALDEMPRWRAILDQGPTRLDFPFLHAMGGDFDFIYPTAGITGAPNIGVTFFESDEFTPAGIERARRFDLIIAGSTWNKDVLERHGLTRVAFCPQGVDLARFVPRARQGRFAGRFAIFSGGKLELRKGQDLVISAFKIFHARHADALLIAAWNSPWPQIAKSIGLSGHVTGAPNISAAGELEVAPWLVAQGIPEDAFVAIDKLPNTSVPDLLKEVDLAVFPNRCEGGTNLVAMECMAMGVPVVLSRNTGHRDLISGENCYTLDQQPSLGELVGQPAYDDWGESSVDEIVARMEQAYSNRADAAARGAAGRAFMQSWDWSQQIDLCLEAIRRIA